MFPSPPTLRATQNRAAAKQEAASRKASGGRTPHTATPVPAASMQAHEDVEEPKQPLLDDAANTDSCELTSSGVIVAAAAVPLITTALAVMAMYGFPSILLAATLPIISMGGFMLNSVALIPLVEATPSRAPLHLPNSQARLASALQLLMGAAAVVQLGIVVVVASSTTALAALVLTALCCLVQASDAFGWLVADSALHTCTAISQLRARANFLLHSADELLTASADSALQWGLQAHTTARSRNAPVLQQKMAAIWGF